MKKTQTPVWEDLVIRPKEAREKPAPAARTAAAPSQMPASYLTHELRAPVTAIRLGLEILQEGASSKLTEGERQMLDLAVRNTFRLEGLVDDIMDYSKILAGRMSLHRVSVDARGLLTEAVDGLRSTALRAGVKLEKLEGEPLPRVHADPRRIVQVLTNLIANAIKFTPARGRVIVSVEPGRFEHEGTLVFKVKDTGRGIPSKDVETVFNLFMQASNTKIGEGSGLGLTLSRMMVELHGGRIWAESWPGLGATFRFTVPVSAEDQFRRVEPYPKPVEYSGLLVSLARRLNAFLALFV